MSDRVQQMQEETAAARDAVLALVDGLSAADFDRPTVNEGWSVKDTLAHLGSIEARAAADGPDGPRRRGLDRRPGRPRRI